MFPSTTTEPGMDTVGPAGTTIDPIQAAVDAAVGEGTANQYGFTGDPTKMDSVMIPWVTKKLGERYTERITNPLLVVVEGGIMRRYVDLTSSGCRGHSHSNHRN